MYFVHWTWIWRRQVAKCVICPISTSLSSQKKCGWLYSAHCRPARFSKLECVIFPSCMVLFIGHVSDKTKIFDRLKFRVPSFLPAKKPLVTKTICNRQTDKQTDTEQCVPQPAYLEGVHCTIVVTLRYFCTQNYVTSSIWMGYRRPGRTGILPPPKVVRCHAYVDGLKVTKIFCFFF